MQNIYKLHYKLDEIEPNLQPVLDYINTKLDVTDAIILIHKREEGRLHLTTVSKCFLTIDFHNKRLGNRTGEEYALYSSLKEYLLMIKKDLENSIVTINNCINFYKYDNNFNR